MNKDKPDCDHCGIELTVGDHPSCCSNCWEENAKYYEQIRTRILQRYKKNSRSARKTSQSAKLYGNNRF